MVKTPHDLQVRFVSDKVLPSSIDNWQALLLWLWSTYLHIQYLITCLLRPARPEVLLDDPQTKQAAGATCLAACTDGETEGPVDSSQVAIYLYL